MEILNGDALQLMEASGNAYDLIILDPDYQDWDYMIENGLIEKALELLNPDGNILLFTKQPFDYNLRIKINPWFRREIAWTFENGGAWVSKKMPLVSTQKIYWMVKSNDFYFNPRTGREYSENTNSFRRSSKVFGGWESKGKYFEMSEDGTWLRDHLHFNKPNTGDIPGKPKELIDVLVRCFCKEDGVILDPFAGSGVIEEVAIEQGKDVIAIEIKPERCDAIIDRLMGIETSVPAAANVQESFW